MLTVYTDLFGTDETRVCVVCHIVVLMQIAGVVDATNPLLGVVNSQPDGTLIMKGNLTLINLNLAGMTVIIYVEEVAYDMWSFSLFLSF